MQLELNSHPSNTLPKPQLHSRKCHHTYNATKCLPRAIWVRSLRFDDPDLNDELDVSGNCTLVYEILLFYNHNRACTIYRTPDDFRLLKSGLGRLSCGEELAAASRVCLVEDVDVVQRYLCEAIKKKGRECALEYFLRRRMEDCGGG